MNDELTRSLRRLLVMCGIAAANHRLTIQAQAIKDAFPLLINDEATRAECELMIDVLLDSHELTSADCNPLHTIVEGLRQSPDERNVSQRNLYADISYTGR